MKREETQNGNTDGMKSLSEGLFSHTDGKQRRRRGVKFPVAQSPFQEIMVAIWLMIRRMKKKTKVSCRDERVSDLES